MAIDKQNTEFRFSLKISILASSRDGNFSILIANVQLEVAEIRNMFSVPRWTKTKDFLCPKDSLQKWPKVEALPPKIMRNARQRDSYAKANTRDIFNNMTKSLLI